MARDGSGTYTTPNTFTTGTTIAAADMNTNFSHIDTALTASIAKDGQTTPTSNLPMGGYKHTNVAAATARTEYAQAGEVQAGGYVYATVGGTADVITLTTTFAPAAYAAGQTVRFKVGSANTGAVTVNWNSLGAKALQTAGGSALAANDLASGDIIECTYDGTAFRVHRSYLPSDVAAQTINITGLTAETAPVVADSIPFYDASAAANRKMTLDDFYKTIDGLTAETAPATGDEVALFDASATAARKMTLANLWNVVAGFTTLSAPATGDSIALYDASATAIKNITLSDLLTVVNGLTEDTAPDDVADYLLSYDASASAVKKVKPVNVSKTRAWVTYNQVPTVSILASHNVTSVTDNATGLFTVNFTTAFSDANYAVVSSMQKDSGAGSNGGSLNIDKATAPTTSACKMASTDSGGTASDYPRNCIAFVR